MALYNNIDDMIDGAFDSGTIDLSESLLNEHSIVLNSDIGLELQSNLWENIFIPAAFMKAKGLKEPDWLQCCDDGAGSAGLYTWAFDPSTEQELFGGLIISRKWDPTTIVYPCFFWTVKTDSDPGEKISWGFEYVMPTLNDRIVGDTTILYGNQHYPNDSVIEAGKVYSTQLTGITPPSNPFYCMQYRIFRDSTGSGLTDDYGDDVYLGAVGLFLQINRIGAPYSEMFPSS